MCQTCENLAKKKRVGFNVFVSQEEVAGLKLLNNKVDCARQALDPSNLQNCADKEKVSLFVGAVLESLASFTTMQREWWEAARTKLKAVSDKISDNTDIYVDFGTGELYILED